MQLVNLSARKILNSRKEETIALVAEVKGIKNKTIETSAPSGKSRGGYEVRAFSSKGIDFSISFLNALGRKLVDGKINFENFSDLEKIENLVRKYDQTTNLSFVGGNTLFILEATILKAIAISQEKKLWQFLLGNKKPLLPRPLGNCIGGGMHIKQEKKADFQEFLLLPKTRHFFDSYFINMQAYKEAKTLLREKDKEWQGTLTDENALASTLDNESILELLQEVREKIKDKFGIDIEIGIDLASSSFWSGKMYKYKNYSAKRKEKTFSKEEQINYIADLAKKNHISYLEDALHEKDFDGSFRLRKKIPHVLICGDDLICTRLERLKTAIKTRAINTIIIKPNQIGSLIETKKVIELAKKNNIMPIISHRSGETMDNTIAHLAIGWQIPIIKTGILGKERLAKLNELLRIERQIGAR